MGRLLSEWPVQNLGSWGGLVADRPATCSRRPAPVLEQATSVVHSFRASNLVNESAEALPSTSFDCRAEDQYGQLDVEVP